MRISFRATMTGLALVGGVALSAPDASAQTNYPRVVCTGGMDCTVDYGPMGQGNLVGGGRVVVTEAGGMNTMVMHLDSVFAQQPRPGFVPVLVGDGSNQMTIYVPASMVEQMRRAASAPAR
jgi:hypothetical protein